MLWNASALNGYPLKALDGQLGKVAGVMFEGAEWTVTSLLVDTGDWLAGRRALVPVAALGQPDPERHHLPVNLTMRQVEEHPDAEATLLLVHEAEPSGNQRSIGIHSLSELTGDSIEATDGHIGHADDFLIDTLHWQVRFLTVHTSTWSTEEKRLISPLSIAAIDWMRAIIHLDVTCQKVKDSPAYLAAETVDGAFDALFHTYYGIRWARR